MMAPVRQKPKESVKAFVTYSTRIKSLESVSDEDVEDISGLFPRKVLYNPNNRLLTLIVEWDSAKVKGFLKRSSLHVNVAK